MIHGGFQNKNNTCQKRLGGIAEHATEGLQSKETQIGMENLKGSVPLQSGLFVACIARQSIGRTMGIVVRIAGGTISLSGVRKSQKNSLRWAQVIQHARWNTAIVLIGMKLGNVPSVEMSSRLQTGTAKEARCFMEGYILYDAEGKRLTRHKDWSLRKSAGWLWTQKQVEEILEKAELWTNQPVFYQHCRLVEEPDGDVNVWAVGEIETL